MPKSKDVAISRPNGGSKTAPTPQNTPLVGAPISQISRPTVPDTISEGEGDEGDDLDDDGEGIPPNAFQGIEGRALVEDDLPFVVRRRVEGLKGVHTEYTKLEHEYKKELLELDRKYLGLYAPVFERRHAIVSGTAEPTEEEVSKGEAETQKDDPEAPPLSEHEGAAEDATEDIKGIPDFWLGTLQNHPEIGELITPRDEKALVNLTDIQLAYLTNPDSGYKLTFHFAPNEFFTNQTLTKTYHYEPEVSFTGDYVYSRAEGTVIDWKEDQDLTKLIELRKQRNKNTNRFRTVKRAVSTPSFFDFFTPPRNPQQSEQAAADFKEGELEDLQDRLELDYQIGEDLKENVIPRAIDYYTGKALEEELESGEDEDEDGEGGEDEGAWDDESGSEEDIPVRSRRQVTKGNGKTDPGECKNQ